jgi:hypothetical protein
MMGPVNIVRTTNQVMAMKIYHIPRVAV